MDVNFFGNVISLHHCFTMQLDTEEVTVENSMSKSFDQIIRMQLDPIWNQLVGVAIATSSKLCVLVWVT